MCSMCPVHLILFDLFALLLSDYEYKFEVLRYVIFSIALLLPLS